MSSSDPDQQQRDREIAQNEAARQTTGDVRVSGWAIVFAVIVGVIVIGLVWSWIGR